MLSSLDADDALIALDGEQSDCCSTSLRLRKILDSSTCDLQQSESTITGRSSATKTTSSAVSRRAISRVVVLHNDKIASFSESSYTDDSNVSPDFFDTPEFWSGSITWW
jgi:hypothetical protein